jgi:hypothetical protein
VIANIGRLTLTELVRVRRAQITSQLCLSAYMHKVPVVSLAPDRLVHGLCSYLPRRPHLANFLNSMGEAFLFYIHTHTVEGRGSFIIIIIIIYFTFHA